MTDMFLEFISNKKTGSNDIIGILPTTVKFLDWAAQKIWDDGLLSLEDGLDCPEYMELEKEIGSDIVKKIVTIICNGVFCNITTAITTWNNFILYIANSNEKEICLLIIEAFYYMQIDKASYNKFKLFMVGTL